MKVYDDVIPVEGYDAQKECVTFVNLAPALSLVPHGVGQIGICVTPSIAAHYPNLTPRRVVRKWLQITRLGMEAFLNGRRGLNLWITDLVTGFPIVNADVTLQKVEEDPFPPQPGGWKILPFLSDSKECLRTKTDENGIAEISNYYIGASSLSVSHTETKDTAVIYPSINLPEATTPKKSILWHVVTDRGVYKPKESVTIRGFTRVQSEIETKDPKAILPFPVLVTPSVSSPIVLTWQVVDSRSVTLLDGEVRMEDGGAFAFAFIVPDSANLGIDQERTRELFLSVHQIFRFRQSVRSAEDGREILCPIGRF